MGLGIWGLVVLGVRVQGLGVQGVGLSLNPPPHASPYTSPAKPFQGPKKEHPQPMKQFGLLKYLYSFTYALCGKP